MNQEGTSIIAIKVMLDSHGVPNFMDVLMEVQSEIDELQRLSTCVFLLSPTNASLSLSVLMRAL